MQDLLTFIDARPLGVTAGEIAQHLPLSRTTLNRRLREAVQAGSIVVTGKGVATRYYSADPLVSLRSYFAKPHTERPLAPYQEKWLAPYPALSLATEQQFASLPSYQLTKRELGKFLIDFSCASSVLEGGTYSFLDTQALLEYGEKSAGKPLEDAFLVLNHKEAFEYLHDHLDLASIYTVHDLLTNDHDIAALQDTAHFLPKTRRGTVREYTEVDIRLSTYLPPFRPGTGYLQQMLTQVLETAAQIRNPIQSAFYLLSRLPYLQPFEDGNKRTSRVICNVPLIKAKLPPLSFVDFGKQDYLVSMLAFYELGDIRLLERCFVNAYQKSIARLRFKS